MDLFGEDGIEGRILELEGLIKRYQDSYYNGEAEITDAEFDALWDELKSLNPSNPVFSRVGADNGSFAKVRHRMPMGSQEKAAEDGQFLKWASAHKYDEYLVEYKLDGASLELQYDSGVLVRAVTRGDGTIGDDITQNARKMGGVLPELFGRDGKKISFTGAVRGEVIMRHSVHDSLYADKANCRNAANGLMKRKDGSGSENLNLIVYDALATDGEGNPADNPFSDEVGKIEWLASCGFDVVHLEVLPDADSVIAYRARVSEMRSSLEFDIDGLVVKERRIDFEDARRTRPDRQIAFKFGLEEAVTVLRDVEWSESGSTYTPVGIFDGVQLNGTTVQRASLANPDTMRRLGVKIGSRVVVVKRGEIIPKIEGVVGSSDGCREIVFPSVCSSCGAPLVDAGTRLFCPNQGCPKRVLHRLQKWISVVDIRDFGDTLIRSLFRDGVVKSVSDIYSLSVEKLTPYFLDENSVGKKDSLGARKVFDSIQAHRKMSLPAFVAGFDIEGVGETVVGKLVDAGFPTLDSLLSASPDDFSAVHGFAEIMANAVVEGLSENRAEMESLVSSGTIEISGSLGAPLPLSGKSFCFTGELRSMKRAEAEALVKAAGGSCKSSVTKDLSYLVTNDKESGSSKNAKAAKYGVSVIDEDEFMSLVKPSC